MWQLFDISLQYLLFMLVKSLTRTAVLFLGLGRGGDGRQRRQYGHRRQAAAVGVRGPRRPGGSERRKRAVPRRVGGRLHRGGASGVVEKAVRGLDGRVADLLAYQCPRRPGR